MQIEAKRDRKTAKFIIKLSERELIEPAYSEIVGNVEYSPVTYLSASDRTLKAFADDELTEYEFVNAFFSAAEQVNAEQAALLSATMEMAMGGPAQPHVGTGGGGATSSLPWRDKNKGEIKRRTR